MKKYIKIFISLMVGIAVFMLAMQLVQIKLFLEYGNLYFSIGIPVVIGLLAATSILLYLFGNKKHMHISIEELIALSVIGFILQQLTYGSAPQTPHTNIFNTYFGFTLLLPLFGTLMHFLISYFSLQKSSDITIISIVLSVLFHFAYFMIYPKIGGIHSEMYGIVFIFGLPIAIVFGLVYAIYFNKQRLYTQNI